MYKKADTAHKRMGAVKVQHSAGRKGYHTRVAAAARPLKAIRYLSVRRRHSTRRSTSSAAACSKVAQSQPLHRLPALDWLGEPPARVSPGEQRMGLPPAKHTIPHSAAAGSTARKSCGHSTWARL